MRNRRERKHPPRTPCQRLRRFETGSRTRGSWPGNSICCRNLDKRQQKSPNQLAGLGLIPLPFRPFHEIEQSASGSLLHLCSWGCALLLALYPALALALCRRLCPEPDWRWLIAAPAAFTLAELLRENLQDRDMLAAWPLCLERLEAELSAEDFHTWVKPLQATPQGSGLAPHRMGELT